MGLHFLGIKVSQTIQRNKRDEKYVERGENVGELLSWEKFNPRHILVFPIYLTKQSLIPTLDSWELFW